tara:strand:+ start:2401 stop:3753 length:1353 start_codon:yes stop_codon:yes gene_type:complete
MKFPNLYNCSIAVIGLGYVGLPLAVEFSERKKCLKTNKSLKRKIIGFDINLKRINELIKGIDSTNEILISNLNHFFSIIFTDQLSQIVSADIFIITVPTPINSANIPDLSPLERASITVGKALKLRSKLKNNAKTTTPIVIYESTVYPGCTEEICLPILEKESNLIANKDFYYGYSPERINPGDKTHKLKDIRKITSGSTQESGIWINNLYRSIIEAGTHLTENIKIAEAAKVIENTQRDLNIALVNELAVICNLINIDTNKVLEAAETKWNFHSYRPGLVGGHCIGVDPYYLTFKAQQLGYLPEVVLAGRRINNSMGERIIEIFVKEFFSRGKDIKNSNILIMGLTFKENCPDIRNTKVIDLIKKLSEFNANILVVDPFADKDKSKSEYGLEIKNSVPKNLKFDGIIIAVAHDVFVNNKLSDWRKLMKNDCILMDVKNILPNELKSIKL